MTSEMTRSAISRALRTVVTAAVGACALVATAAPAPAREAGPGAAASGFLNLHQCAYYATSLDDHFSTFVTPSGDGRYATGTERSATADTAAECGPGNGNHNPVPVLHGVRALDLGAGRYLNLQQCDYYRAASTDHFTTLVTPSGDGRYATGTKVSNTPETRPACGPGNGSHVPNPGLSAARALDLTAGRHLNLHQCVYYSERQASHLTTVVPGADSRYTTGTNVSDTADTRPVCGPGNGDHVPVPLLSAVRSVPLG
ncbi:hypothetical protein [Streptomyces sp. CC224B]|uniref:hypothetical protein n=1 Tax=Streptomyces sp. CC224B TaxID=3044571 RepID=UPI0024A9A44E|nr:hypothetical protein [Streptomyces sp. CC224B]